ncbi:hypothetical protein F4677DRAFT_451445 [Hypoxylon crocopeplum]|nr:hypothetical protein F4677DRAFT_451445 [Hypoxylon crocopeplum]
MLESIPENEMPFLPKEDETKQTTRYDKQNGQTTRILLVAVALVSALVSALGIIILHNLLPTSPISSSINPQRQELLPSLNLPPLGDVLRAFKGDSTYYAQDMNTSREAWMSLFPPGMGYVSMDNIKDAGDIPQIFQDMSTDGSGRFCIAAFHQLHCLFLIYADFRRAMNRELSHTDAQSLRSSHSLHCFDYLRESIMCSADSALEPFLADTQGNGVDGFGSVHQCRDFKSLSEWIGVDEKACALVRENYTTNSIHAELPSGYMNLQGEMCLGNPLDQCVLNNAVLPAPEPGQGVSCNQGSVPSYYIDVREALDVNAALNFSRKHRVPLAIKNSGHDYMTRNSQKGSLALWVHNLQDLSFYDDFVPEGCTADTGVGLAITAGTGVSTNDLYNFANEHGSTFIGGYSPTVAASGGWVLGGGHSVLSPVYGLGADRVVEFKIVTPDGVLRVANQCQHEDLFWALRGGGGGTFGVVLEATHRVEPSMPVAIANIRLPSNGTAETSMNWIELMARQSLTWGQQGWGGHAGGLYLTYMNPVPDIANLTDRGIAARDSMSAATKFALSVGGTSVVEVLPNFLDAWNKYVIPGALTTAGVIRVLATRLIPRKLFEDEAGIAKLMGFMAAAQGLGFDPRNFYCPVDTPFVYGNGSKPESKKTSVQPAWYNSLWDVSTSLTIPWNASYAERLQNMTALTRVTVLAEELTGDDGGTYLNEANPFTPNWRESWWGDNYAALLDIKKKYDPEGLLKCWKCVGFEDEDISTDRFSCQGKLQLDVDRNLGIIE